MPPSIVLGLGNCVDYEIVLAAAPLQRAVEEAALTAADIGQPASIVTERDLLRSILAHVATDTGGEHYVASAEVLERFAGRFGKRVTLGGTSVRAAIVLSRLGLHSTLHLVSFNEHVARLLPADVDYVCSGYRDSTFPHLVVQYDTRAAVRVPGARVAARSSNRLIYVNDPANENLAVDGRLGELLRGSRLFLLSGFNSIRDPDVLDRRLAEARASMRALPADAIVYYEDAAFHTPGLSRRVRDSILAAVRFYGMNEDEMQQYVGRRVDLLSAPEVLAALSELHELLPGPTLVVHTRWWAIAYGRNAASLGAMLDEAMAVAATRYAWGDDLTAERVADSRTLPRHPEAARFVAAFTALAGDAACARAAAAAPSGDPTTVGLGDAFAGGFLAAVARGLPHGGSSDQDGAP